VNVPFLSALITRVDTDTWDVACVDSGDASGSAAAYSMGFTYAHSGSTGSLTGGTLTVPSGGDVQLISLRLHLAASTRDGSTYTLVLPASATNGAGANTSDDDVFLPFQMVRSDADSLGALSATLSKNVSGSFSTFQVGALPSSTIGLFILWQF
jgi:hypothetical protein